MGGDYKVGCKTSPSVRLSSGAVYKQFRSLSAYFFPIGFGSLLLVCAPVAVATDAQSDPDATTQVDGSSSGPVVASESWGTKIIDLLNEQSRRSLDQIPERVQLGAGVEALVQNLTLSDLRWLAQDGLYDSLDIDPKLVVEAFKNKADLEGSEIDQQLARLYALSLVHQGDIPLDRLEPFQTSPHWPVNVAAHLEVARASRLTDGNGAVASVRDAVLAVPNSVQDQARVEEAYYNIAVVSQMVAILHSDMPTAFASTVKLLELASKQGRRSDWHGIIYNLAQLYAVLYSTEEALKVTEELVLISRKLDNKKNALSLALHGKYLTLAGRPSIGLRHLEEAKSLDAFSDTPHFEVDLELSIIQSLAGLKRVEEAQQRYAQLSSELAENPIQSVRARRVEATLLKVSGQAPAAYELIDDTLDTTYRRFLRARRISRPFLTLTSIGVDSAVQKSAPLPLALDIADIAGIGQSTVVGGLSRDAYRDLKRLEVELELLNPARNESSTTARDQLLDAIMGRSDSDASLLLQSLRNTSGNSDRGMDGLDSETLDLFSQFLAARSIGSGLPQPSDNSEPTLQALAWLLRAELALEQGRIEMAYSDVERARYIALRHDDANRAIRYDLSGLTLSLAALEGNPDVALQAADAHISSARDDGRADPLASVMTGVISALERAGHLSQALELSDQFVQLAQTRDDRTRVWALYAKGRLLYRDDQFARAVIFLQEALDSMDTTELEVQIQRALYPSFAGSGQIAEARGVRRELTLNLVRLDNTAVTQAARPYLAHGDALIAEAESPGSEVADSALRAWLDAFQIAEANQRQRLATLSGYRTNAAQAIMRLEADQNRADASTLASRWRAVQYLGWLLGIVTVGLLSLFVWTLVNLRRARALQRSSRRASAVKGQFLNMIGHEARIRLQGIASFADSLKAASIALEHLPTVQVIGKQADSLSRSISDLVASARILSGDDPHRTDILVPEEFERSITSRALEAIGKRDVAFSFTIAPSLGPVLVEKRYLETAIDRLVRAAARDTRSGAIEVTMSSDQSLRGPRLNIVVEDTGAGLSPSEIDSLLNRFETDASGMSRLDGVEDLDFPLAQQAVDALGGVLRVHSEVGKGTRVSVSVPVSRAAANDTNEFEAIEVI